MRLLYGTTNEAKLEHMKEMLHDLDVEIIGVNDISVKVNIEESGESPLENAVIKAKAYYELTGIPCFSADSGLYIEGLDKQPGVFVRRVNGKYLNDDEFIEHYKNIAKRLGGKVKAQFKNAICLILDKDHIFSYDGDEISDYFLLTSNVHPIRKMGFPMDSIAIDIDTGYYFVEDEKTRNNERLIRGFRDFFIKHLNIKEKKH